MVREIDIQVFSNDYDWRGIFKALNKKDEEYEELRRVAVVKYMQYLRSRQDVIKQTYKVRRHEASADDDDPKSHNGTLSDLEDTGDSFKETNIFDSISVEVPADPGAPAFTRLPKREAVHLKLDDNDNFEIKLSKHLFIFRSGGLNEFIDEAGTVHQLANGKNIIGRDAVCNVVVENSFRDVSRMHLIIEPFEDGVVRFTDLSSHGTFLPARLLSQE